MTERPADRSFRLTDLQTPVYLSQVDRSLRCSCCRDTQTLPSVHDGAGRDAQLGGNVIDAATRRELISQPVSLVQFRPLDSRVRRLDPERARSPSHGHVRRVEQPSNLAERPTLVDEQTT